MEEKTWFQDWKKAKESGNEYRREVVLKRLKTCESRRNKTKIIYETDKDY